jgi:hypothetical protein
MMPRKAGLLAVLLWATLLLHTPSGVAQIGHGGVDTPAVRPPLSVGWPAGVDPNNIIIATINQNSMISAIIGTVEVAVGGAATVVVKKAPSGTACSAGTTLHSGSFDANGTAGTNQTLPVTTAALAPGDRLCLQSTGSSWTGGNGIGTVTIFVGPR